MGTALFDDSLCSDTQEWTHETLAALPVGQGLVLFSNADGRPIQLLQVAQIRRTAQARLLGDADRSARKADLSELTACIHYKRCDGSFESQMHYLRLAHALFADRAGDWIALPRPALAVVHTAATLPHFDLSANPARRDDRRVFGLFPSRKAARLFGETLNTVFGLCRNPALVGSGQEASCPYRQMGTCPAACVEPSARAAYQQGLAEALAVAAGDLDAAITDRTDRMRTASQARHYEQAQTLKNQVDALAALKAPAFRWAGRLDDLAVLHIDQARKIKVQGRRRHVRQYAAWKITADAAHPLGRCDAEDMENFVTFLNTTWDAAPPAPYAATAVEHLATLSLFLFRHNAPGLWLNARRRPDAAKLKTRFAAAFADYPSTAG